MNAPALLPALGILQGTYSQTVLITPFQNGERAYAAFLNGALTRIRTLIYGCTLESFFGGVETARARGVDIRIIFDHTQAAGPTERAQIEKLRAAGFVQGREFLIGTSPRAHQIIHTKATVIDGLHVEEGSWNYSASADLQVNSLCFTTDAPDRAAFFEAAFDDMWAWITEHEPQGEAPAASVVDRAPLTLPNTPLPAPATGDSPP